MDRLKNYAKRTFIITQNVRDELILSDNSCVQLDHFLHIYLKKHLNYDSVVFLDAKGVYYFDDESRNVLNKAKEKEAPVKKGLSKLKKHNRKIVLTKKKESNFPDTRLRFTYEGDILEISQFILSHLRQHRAKFAFVVYDGSLFEKLPQGSDIWIQMQGMLRNEIYALPSSNRNIFIWVDGEDHETLSRRFIRLCFDFLFTATQNNPEPVGQAQLIRVPTACKDEIQRAVCLHSLKCGQFPSFKEVRQYAPLIAGAMRQNQDTLKTFHQYLDEKTDFWPHIKACYSLKSGQQDAYEQLKSMTGLTSVKEEISRLVNGIEKKEILFKTDYALTPERFKTVKSDSLPYIPHLALLGNPGTGKTTVARLIGKILRQEGVLESGHLVEVTPENLVAGYSGQTAIKTKKQVEKALGGILFIDEAYSLVTDERDAFGLKSLGELIKAMSDYQGRFMIIFAGYKNETEQMLKYNPGSARRVQHIDLPDYSAEELHMIMDIYLKKILIPADPIIFNSLDTFCTNLLSNRELFGGNHFGNAGVVINQIDIAQQTARAGNASVLLPVHFEYADFFQKLHKNSEDLDQLIGLEKIKKKLSTIFRRKQIETMPPGHYIFSGNPGTGKSVVAKQMAKQLYEKGMLKSAKLNVYTVSALIGGHLGATENRLEKILNQSLDGVLFIDEAHQMAEKHSYGDKALQTILPFMENHRKDFSLIFAGYPEKIEKLYYIDPGLKDRFDDTIIFEDYSPDELVEIFHKMFKEETAYELVGVANNVLKKKFQNIKQHEGNFFSNARTVRKFISKLKNAAIESAASNQDRVYISGSHVEQVAREWK